jgi:hypothetical protein
MKSAALLVIGIFVGFVLLSNEPLLNFANGINNPSKSKKELNPYGDYDPGKDKQFSKEERDYFNKIAKFSEFEGESEISRWTTDVKIFVRGEKRGYLMDELDRIVNELNEIIDPISISIVDKEHESNYQIILGSQKEYNAFEPDSEDLTEGNWGLFVINSGKIIKRGSMYVDIIRCKDIASQKHLLREELTQSLGLTNDSYTYPESIFQQKWTETTEYAPIDRKLIDMLYNHW